MSCAIIGWTGFVGQYLTLANQTADLYNSSNIQTLRGKTYDIIYFSGMPAEKWKINQSPEEDARLATEFCDILTSVCCNTFVLVSTVDVLDCTIAQDECGDIWATHPYGHHRRQLERFVESHFPQHVILRLPGLFGQGLKKNIVFDLLHNNQIENICLESEFQWYNLEHLIEDIDFCRAREIRKIHLVSPPIRTRDIIASCFADKISQCVCQRRVVYCLTTQYARPHAVFSELCEYIRNQQQLSLQLPRIAVSNIAWPATDFQTVSKILGRYNIQRIEMAFTTIHTWDDWNDEIIAELRKSPFRYPSCQSVLYNTGIELFRDTDGFFTHIEKVLTLCQQLGITRLVFGSPKARHPYAATLEEQCAIFRRFGDLSARAGVIVCLEPNSHLYGCTWLTNLTEVAAFIQAVDHPAIRINFDFGNYIMENDTTPITSEVVALIENVQVSAPHLAPLMNPLPDEYVSCWKALRAAGYVGSVSLEMLPGGNARFLLCCDRFMKLLSLE
jgi:sugar phosphate isomerase/epimerase